VAPAQTLTDKEYQRLRDASLAIIREMGVECGGSNVQMAVNPVDGEQQQQQQQWFWQQCGWRCVGSQREVSKCP
jgi:hypothetical protein